MGHTLLFEGPWNIWRTIIMQSLDSTREILNNRRGRDKVSLLRMVTIILVDVVREPESGMFTKILSLLLDRRVSSIQRKENHGVISKICSITRAASPLRANKHL